MKSISVKIDEKKQVITISKGSVFREYPFEFRNKNTVLVTAFNDFITDFPI